MSDLYSLSEAKKIYTNQLCKLLQPQIYKGLSSLWNLCKDNEEPLKNFQKKLEHVPRWNSMIISDEYNRIIEETECTYIDKLLDAVFIANTKILSALNKNKKVINITVPSPKKFLHSCYISCAYKLYSDPFLFDDREHGTLSYKKKQKCLKEIMDIIYSSISETIENLLPIEDLLNTCLTKDDEEDKEENKEQEDIEDLRIESLKIDPVKKEKEPDLDVFEGDDLLDAEKTHMLVNDDSEEEQNYDNTINPVLESEEESEDDDIISVPYGRPYQYDTSESDKDVNDRGENKRETYRGENDIKERDSNNLLNNGYQDTRSDKKFF